MFKRKVLVFVGVFLFLGCKIVFAEVVINEVQIGGITANDEFIELYNFGDSSESLTGFYIKKKTSSGSESNFVVASRFEGVSIPVNGYLLLGREGSYAGSVSSDIFWPSSYSLASNNSLTLYRGNETDKDEVSWGDIENSSSFQKTSSGWITALSTPKALNKETESSSSNEENDNEEKTTTTTSFGSSVSSSENKIKIIPIFKASILAPSLAFTGEPIVLDLSVKYGNENYAVGKYFWNFGDGTSLEKSGGFEKISHTYFYPGEYNVSLEYFKSNGSFFPEAKNEIVIKVVPLTVSISKVGDQKDFFVELSNNADSKIDISKWTLSSFDKIFTLPKNTTIAGKKSIIISGRVSGFVLGDEKNLKLISSTGDIVFDYSPILALNKITSNGVSSTFLNTINIESSVENKITDKIENFDDNLSAIALLGNTDATEYSDSYLFYGVFVVLIAGAATVVYFIRRKKSVLKPEECEDLEILDE